MSQNSAPDLIELHAYADGLLDHERASQIKQYLATNDEARIKVEEWQLQNEAIGTLFDGVKLEEIPEKLNPHAIAAQLRSKVLPIAANNNKRWRQIAAAIAIAVVSSSMGWFANQLNTTNATPDFQLADNAMRAHATYVVEVAHPVDVKATRHNHLVSWLSKRLGEKINAPELSSQGYSLVGGNLLPAGEGVAAQFMYENRNGKRITLYATRNHGDKLAAFQFASKDNLNAFYWMDADFSYVLSGEITRSGLHALAKLVYEQLE